MDARQRWNRIVDLHKQYYKTPETTIQNVWENICVEILGFSRLEGEVERHRSIYLGSTERVIPDIIVKDSNKDLFVIELKLHNAIFEDSMRRQLFSYLKQLKVNVGVLVCEKLYIYSYDYSKQDSEQLFVEIPFEKDLPEGIKFVDIFNKKEFAEELVHKYAYDKNGNKLMTWEEPSNIIEDFMKLLDEAINDSKDMLIERFNWICSQPPESAKFMYENNIMAGYVKEEGIKSALKHGTLAIGQLGLAETLQILIGENHTTEKGMELAKKIEALFKKRCAEFKEEYRLNFGVYYSPAENLCHTALKKFRDKYGVIPNVSDKDFFTNSMHIPVWEKVSPFEKIDLESQLTGYSSAGCITYVELEESVKHNIDGLEELVNYAMDKDIPYFAINVPNDTCLDCGYTNEMNDVCPKCGSNNIQRLRRVTGYLTNDYKTAFNLGKQDEVERRIKHDKVGVFNNEDK